MQDSKPNFKKADYLAVNPVTCSFPLIGYDAKVRDCGEPSVLGTQGCWCAQHGIMMESDILNSDRRESNEEYKLLPVEREVSFADLDSYLAAEIAEDILWVRAEIAMAM